MQIGIAQCVYRFVFVFSSPFLDGDPHAIRQLRNTEREALKNRRSAMEV